MRVRHMNASLDLVAPGPERLAGYMAALHAGWSPSTTRDVSREELAAIREDAALFLRRLRGEAGGTVRLASGEEVPRLPGKVFWLWDGAFCGAINLRHQPGTEALPPHVSGHVGYAVVPWKRRRGYATRALGLLLPVAHRLGLPRLLVTTARDNTASRRVIEANGGIPADGAGRDDDAAAPRLRFWVSTRPHSFP